MPLDPSIVLGLQTQPPNLMDAYARGQQMRQQQQAQQSLVDERRQQIADQQFKLKEAQQKAAEQQAYEQELAAGTKPGMSLDDLRERIRTGAAAPHLQAFDVWRAKQDESAANLKKTIAEAQKFTEEAKKSQGEAAIHGEEYMAGHLGAAKLVGPSLLPTIAEDIIRNFPQMEEEVKRHVANLTNPQMVPTRDDYNNYLDGLMSQNPGANKQLNEGPMQAANAQKAQAENTVAQQVAAGTRNGMTPAQQSEDFARQAANRLAQIHAGIAQSAEARAQAKAKQDATLFDTSQGTGPTQVNPDGKRNEDFLKTLPTPTADLIKRVAEGRQPLPTRFSANDTYWHTVLDLVGKYDPSFDAVNYNSRNKTREKFTSGKEAGMVTDINTAIRHLEELTKKIDQIHDTGFTPLNYVVNTAAGSVSPAANNFDVVVNRVAPEVTRAYKGGEPTIPDIDAFKGNFSISKTKEMNHQAVQETAKLLESKINELANQVKVGMGTDEIPRLRPDAQAALDRLMGRTGASSGTTQDEIQNGITYTVTRDSKGNVISAKRKSK